MSRPFTMSIPQLIAGFQKAYIERNFGKLPEHIYLPPDLYDLAVEWVLEQFSTMVPPIDVRGATYHTMNGMVLHERTGYDIIVTSEELL